MREKEKKEMSKKIVVPCIPSKVVEEYIVAEKSKLAIIRFVNGTFEKCSYNLTGSYTYEGWTFLGKVAARIEKIKQQKARGG